MPPDIVLCPKIDVHHWDASSVYVECPYCEKIHRHGFKLSGKRASHCVPSGQYEFIFPIDETRELVGYEIDKRKACFVNISSQADERNHTSDFLEEDEAELADLFHNKMNISDAKENLGPGLSLDEDSREVESITSSDGDTFQQKRILFAISNCILGKLDAISQYLSTSSETELFLRGKNEAGNTTLILAAAEESDEMVLLLLEHGADINVTNNAGRSALMEAALWGRVESVKVLLNADADKNLRDHKGHCAIDFAQPWRENEEERFQRSGPAAADSLPERNRDRRHIVILLGNQDAEKQRAYTRPPSESERIKYSFRKSESEKTIALHGPILNCPVQNLDKTVAVLFRGDQFIRMPATSGWDAKALPPDDKVGRGWIEQVYYIAATVGHEFKVYPDGDHGKPGLYSACHAEKKLIAYFIDRHVFTPRDKELDLELRDSIRGAKYSLDAEKSKSATWGKVRDLEARKVKLDHELSCTDVRRPNKPYDKQKVAELKHDINEVKRELSNLELDNDVAVIRAEDKKLQKLLKREEIHYDLMALSENEPPVSLRQAVILSSNKICEDCIRFNQKVNAYFQLNIEVSWPGYPS